MGRRFEPVWAHYVSAILQIGLLDVGTVRDYPKLTIWLLKNNRLVVMDTVAKKMRT